MMTRRTGCIRWIGSPAVRVLGAFLAVGPACGAASAQDAGPSVEARNRRCLECHGQPELDELSAAERLTMVITDEPGASDQGDQASPIRRSLYLAPGLLDHSVHSRLACVDCHADAAVLPHRQHLERAACGSCHGAAESSFLQGAHAEALARGDPLAPTCATCHGDHDILPSHHRRSQTYPLNVIDLCAGCHERHADKTPNGQPAKEYVISYLNSVHGQAVRRAGLIVAATCADCHGAHEVHRSDDPRSSIHRDNVPAVCGSCHEGVAETYVTSIHGKKQAEGDERAPVCTDCHTAHSITDAGAPDFMRDVIGECGECHNRPEMSKGRRVSFYESYRASYHGQVTQLGSLRAARCADCHGAHDILPINEEGSRLHGKNRIQTCRTCHEKVGESFARYDPHADYRDASRYPILHAIWLYFLIVMSGAFGFFGLHSLLWFVRSAIERRRSGGHTSADRSGRSIRRFTRMNRLNHALLIVSFFGLTLTGMPLFFSQHEWAYKLAAIFGGGEGARIFHRIFAVMLLGNFVIHIYGIASRARQHRGSLVRHLFVGPHTLLPRWKDVTDCIGMFRWFIRGGERPKLDRWTYWEKFDYLAEIFGTFVIGGSGLLLWFPEFFSRELSVTGQVYNGAHIVHGYEALLAVGFIFTIHFFNAHLRPEKFPVDDVIFTGKLSEEEFRHERPLEYERLVRDGRLDELAVPPPLRWQRVLAVVVGLVAMTIGVAMTVLIILGGIQAI